mgnify:CR=1 FL=1
MMSTNTTEQKNCYYCVNKNIPVDFKDVLELQRFVSHYARIVPRRRSGLCAKHQRKVATAIKRARIMGLLPFIKK